MKITIFLLSIFLVSCVTETVQNNPEPTPIYNDPTPIQSSETSIVSAEGKGSSAKLAISDAWRQAMQKFVKENVDTSYYWAKQDEIETFIIENWRSYTVGDPETPEIEQRYDNRRVIIRAQIKTQLLHDVQQQIQ